MTLLEQAGFEAYVVGGCTRDALLGLDAKDWDITTSAFPEETKAVFSEYRTIDTGIQHGTVAVLIDGMQLEITTYRVDGEYTDSRHPDEVSFTRTLHEDLARRDFTMNAICYNPSVGWVDDFGGMDDIEQHRIRCVGTPEKRFTEDALRILRALRFSSVLGFSIEKETSLAIHSVKQRISCVAVERITEEMKKLLCGNNVYSVLRDYRDVISVVLPELGQLSEEAYEMSYRRVAAVLPEEELRFAMLLLNLGEESLQRFRLSNQMRSDIQTLMEYQDLELSADRRNLCLCLNKVGKTGLQKLILLKKGLCLAEDGGESPRLDTLCTIEEAFQELLAQNPVFRCQDLEVDGSDLLALGMKPGPEVGRQLQELLEKVMEEELPNERNALLNYLAERLS